jgi:hypothetical protein
MALLDDRGTGVKTTKEAVAGAGAGGALAVIVSWILGVQGIPVPGEAAAAMGSLFGFVAAYLVPLRR